MEILLSFVIQALVFWLLFKAVANLAKKRAEEAQHEMPADEMQKLLQTPNKVQYPIAMASVFMLLAIVFTVLSIVAALIVFL